MLREGTWRRTAGDDSVLVQFEGEGPTDFEIETLTRDRLIMTTVSEHGTRLTFSFERIPDE